MTNGATKEYKFGNKNNWRRWNWNRICEHLQAQNIKPHQAIVLYLAGEKDLDRNVAMSHGLKSENLICVERDSDASEKLKSVGNLVVNSDLADALSSWNPKNKVNVILADFCCGLCNPVMASIIGAMNNPAFSTCVVSLNLMRGRDALAVEVMRRQNIGLNHRAAISITEAIVGWTDTIKRGWLNSAGEEMSDSGKEMFRGYIKRVVEGMNHNSYKSGNVFFDSCVYENPNYFQLFNYIRALKGVTATISDESCSSFVRNQSKTARSINALMAVRTSRMNAAMN